MATLSNGSEDNGEPSFKRARTDTGTEMCISDITKPRTKQCASDYCGDSYKNIG